MKEKDNNQLLEEIKTLQARIRALEKAQPESNKAEAALEKWARPVEQHV